MKILFAASELKPFVSSGTMAASVSRMLKSVSKKCGVECVLPCFSAINRKKFDITPTGISFDVQVGEKYEKAEIFESIHEESGAKVIFVSNPYFERDGLYGNVTGDYPDNSERFIFFSRAVLEYAKAHPEQKWLFKPHPKLRSRLVEIGFMTEAEVDLYYKEWERTGAVCYDGNYARWFMESKAMVTDSNSFLLEYMAVGKPLLHLVPQTTNMKACAEAESVFKTFYAARDVDEMMAWLKIVVEDGQDPRGDERRDAARVAAVLDNHAGKRIVDWLLSLNGGTAT